MVVYGSKARVTQQQSRFLTSEWQSLPTDKAGFREAEPSYDEAQTLCHIGWQSQPTIDHNLYTNDLEIRRLTLYKRTQIFIYNSTYITRDDTYTLYVAILP